MVHDAQDHTQTTTQNMARDRTQHAAQDPREREIQRQFLDEAQAYLTTLESAVLGLAGSRVDLQKVNEAMRASHSIKGGAAMMGYQTLSAFSHRLEDSFKVLKTKRQSLEVSLDLENLLLAGVDCLHRIIQTTRQEQPLDEAWLAQDAYPLFDQLGLELGDAEEETAASVLGSEEGGQALLSIIFESEVESVLQQLEDLLQEDLLQGHLHKPDSPATTEAELRGELVSLAGELGGLGEMLQLPAFSNLCEAVIEAVDGASCGMRAIAQAALSAWRRAQALVMTQQLDLIPTRLELPLGESATVEPVRPDALENPVPLPAILEPFIVEPVRLQPVSFEAIAPNLTVTRGPFLPELVLPEPVLSAPTQLTPTAFEAPDLAAFETPEAIAPEAIAPDDLRTVRVSLKRLEELNDSFGELTIERNALMLYCDRLRSLTQLLKQRVHSLDQNNQDLRTSYQDLASRMRSPVTALVGVSGRGESYSSGLGLQSLRGLGMDVGEPLFDRLEMDQYGSLELQSQAVLENIVQLQEVTTDVDLSLEEADQTLRNLNKTTKQLRNQLTHLRMRPLSDILDRFPRALRELGQEHGKRVALKLEGSETLVDRHVLEALQEPLMHLLRNAFDHGLETPAERQAQGKPEEGRVTIRAFQRGNRTLVEFQDDGRGIALDKVRAKAETMGLDAELLGEASQAELLSLIFEPGFSTRDQVTALSGRGVGMDVVRDRLKPVRGEITVNTQPGEGTTFTLAVPFSLAVVRVLIVEIQGVLLAIPADGVAEVVLVNQVPELQAGGSSFDWNGQHLARIDLSPWLQFNCPRPPYSLEANPKIDTPALLIINDAIQVNGVGQPVGLEIDRSWGEQEVAVRRIEGQLSLPVGVSNCTILGDGRVIPLVSVSEVIGWIARAERLGAEAGQAEGEAAIAPPEFASPTVKPAVLIVDDSINVRRFLALTLQKAGYRVEQAKDGLQALELLSNGIAVQAIICDIEMPRLDGYGVLAQVKADPAIAHLPVAMLTSRSGDKHRKLAMNLGASAYFSKPYNEPELLEQLEAMIRAV